MRKRTRHYLVLPLLLPLPLLLEASPEQLEAAREATREWVNAEKAISREALDWETQQVLLGDLLAVAERRVETLEDHLAELKSSRSLGEQEREELLEQEAALDARAEQIRNFLADAEPAVRALRARLPEPLQEELEALFQRIPQSAETTSAGIGERMQTLAGILTGIREFDGRITVSESIRPLPTSRQEAVFRILWVGLGQAYYLAPDDAGYGEPGEDGWRWHSQPELAERVSTALSLAEGREAAPRWLDLPVHLSVEGAQ